MKTFLSSLLALIFWNLMLLSIFAIFILSVCYLQITIIISCAIIGAITCVVIYYDYKIKKQRQIWLSKIRNYLIISKVNIFKISAHDIDDNKSDNIVMIKRFYDFKLLSDFDHNKLALEDLEKYSDCVYIITAELLSALIKYRSCLYQCVERIKKAFIDGYISTCNNDYSLTNKKWEQLRQEILVRDNNACVLCGISDANTSLHVHHIILRKDGGKDENKNLLTVCKDCHCTFPNHEKVFREPLTIIERLKHRRQQSKRIMTNIHKKTPWLFVESLEKCCANHPLIGIMEEEQVRIKNDTIAEDFINSVYRTLRV